MIHQETQISTNTATGNAVMTDNADSMATVGDVDSRIFELNLNLRRIPSRIAEARRQLEAEEALLNEVLIPWTELENEINEREATIQIALDTIEKFEAHMKRVTTQKEYIAARKQVDEARRLNARLQDEILERRVKQEELNPRLEERRETHKKVLESFEKEESGITAEQEQLEKEIAELTEQVQKGLKKLGDSAFQYYQRLIKGGKMPAVVPVISGSCHGCNMALPPQVYNLLLGANGKMFTCPTCSRIIYPQQEAETPQASAATG